MGASHVGWTSLRGCRHRNSSWARGPSPLYCIVDSMPAVMQAVHDAAGACRVLALLFLRIGLVRAQQALQSAWSPLQQVRLGAPVCASHGRSCDI